MPSRRPISSIQTARLYDGNPKEPPGSTVLFWVFLGPPALLAVALALVAFFQPVSPPSLLPTPSSTPSSPLPSTTTSVATAHTTSSSDLQSLRLEVHRLQRQVQSNQLQCKKLEQAIASPQRKVRTVEAAIHTNQSKLALTLSELRDLRRRTQHALEKQATLQNVANGGALAEALDSLPQPAVALVVGLLGVYMILGPLSLFQGSAAFVGSTIGGLFTAGAVYFAWLNFRSAGAVHSLDEHSFVDAVCNLVDGRGVWMVYMLWFAFLCLGIWRYLNGFQCALYAVVDDVHMTKPGSGGRRFRVDMAKEQDIGQFIDQAALEEGDPYLLDNSQLRSAAAYIAFRNSQNMEDKDESRIVAYGSVVHGVDQGDGWLQVGDRYLPMVIRGVKVLILQQSEDADQNLEHWQSAGSVTMGAAQSQEAATPNQCSFEDLVREASNMNIHDRTPDQALLRAAWEASGTNVEVAVENLVQRLADQRPGSRATGSEGGRAGYAKTWN